MKKTIFLFSLLGLLNNGFAQQKKQAQQLDSIFSMMYQQNQFNGAVLIAEKGKVIFERAYGFSNEKLKTVNQPKTIFELASCSKQFTAAAILILKRQGKLNYTDQLSKYLPELSFWDNVTIEHLIHHTSGLPEFIFDMPTAWDETKIATNQDLINFYANRKDSLQFAPGSRHRYTNTNYALLASIIERVSGMIYADFLRKNIFQPLKMKHTFAYNRRQSPNSIKNYAIGYVWAKNSFEKVTSEHPSYDQKMVHFLDGIVGNAKVSSTVEDIYQWLQALKQNTLFSQAEFDEMTAIRKTSTGKNIPYGFGLELAKGEQKFSFGHTGSWDGYATFIYHNVVKDRSIITLQNFKMGAYPFATINQILDGKPIGVEYKQKIVLSEAEIKKLAGTYVDEKNKDEIQFISYLDGHLVHNSKRVAWDMRFFPVAANEFQAVRQGGADAVLRFTTLVDGSEKLEMLQYGEVVGTGIKIK